MIGKLFYNAVIITLLFVTSSIAGPLDSFRIENRNGKDYIVHEVDPGETLYSISKRYKSSMNAIADATPEVKRGLHDSMIVYIPHNRKVNKTLSVQSHTVLAGETLYSISRIYDISVVQIMEWNDLISSDLEVGQILKIGGDSPPQKIDYVLDGMRIHVVQAGEGLYAIARNFDVSVDDLVEWNELESSALNLGQEIIVGKIRNTPQLAEEVEEPVVVAVVAEASIEHVPMIKKQENGMASSIEGMDDESYLGMHRELEVGSVVSVRNEMNNQVVFVRIIGKLPDTGVNEKLIIRLSKGAVQQLQAIDPKFRVEISYLQPK